MLSVSIFYLLNAIRARLSPGAVALSSLKAQTNRDTLRRCRVAAAAAPYTLALRQVTSDPRRHERFSRVESLAARLLCMLPYSDHQVTLSLTNNSIARTTPLTIHEYVICRPEVADQ